MPKVLHPRRHHYFVPPYAGHARVDLVLAERVHPIRARLSDVQSAGVHPRAAPRRLAARPRASARMTPVLASLVASGIGIGAARARPIH